NRISWLLRWRRKPPGSPRWQLPEISGMTATITCDRYQWINRGLETFSHRREALENPCLGQWHCRGHRFDTGWLHQIKLRSQPRLPAEPFLMPEDRRTPAARFRLRFRPPSSAQSHRACEYWPCRLMWTPIVRQPEPFSKV